MSGGTERRVGEGGNDSQLDFMNKARRKKNLNTQVYRLIHMHTEHRAQSHTYTYKAFCECVMRNCLAGSAAPLSLC